MAAPKRVDLTGFTLEQLDFILCPHAGKKGVAILCTSEAGGGKCFGIGTQLMMYDGTSKAVEDIEEGDVLMGDDSTPRTVQIGSLRRGNTGDDDAAMPKGLVLPPFKPGQHPNLRSLGPDSTGGYPCNYTGCFHSSHNAQTRAYHEKNVKSHALPRPATYRITSINQGRSSWTCNGAHILVLRINQKPTATFKVDNRFGYNRVVRDLDNHVHFASVMFDTEAKASEFRTTAVAIHRPLVWEGSVDQFLKFTPLLQRGCTMYQPEYVDFKPPTRSLRDRLEGAFGRDLPIDLVHDCAWAIGMWLADGIRVSAEISQIREDKNNPSHSHTTAVDHLINIYHRLYSVSLERAGSILHPIKAPTTAGNIIYTINMGKLFWKVLCGYQLNDNKHFNNDLLREDRETRSHLLSGIIDGDGYLEVRKKLYEVSAKDTKFMDGLIQLSRSLGLSTGKVGQTRCTNKNTGEVYLGWRIHIGGEELCDIIKPQLAYKRCPTNEELGRNPNKDQRCDGFKVEKIDHADYYGFTVDGNGRFLFADFVVTHNSTCISKHIEAHPDLQYLYLVLNSEPCLEAARKMQHLKNVDVFTFSSLARHYLVEERGMELLTSDSDWQHEASLLIQEYFGVPLTRTHLHHLCLGLHAYWKSADRHLSPRHFVQLWPSAVQQRFTYDPTRTPPTTMECMQWATQIMKWMQVDKTLPMCFQSMTKIFQLSDIDLSEKYDVCTADEAMDMNKVTTATLASRPWTLYNVGDRAQALNEWLGCHGSLDSFQYIKHYHFPASHRFGPAIATVRDGIFAMAAFHHPRMIGAGSHATVIRPFSLQVDPVHDANMRAIRQMMDGDNAITPSMRKLKTLTDTKNDDAPIYGRWKTPRDMYNECFGPTATEHVLYQLNANLACRNATLLTDLVYGPFLRWAEEGEMNFILADSLRLYITHLLQYYDMDAEDIKEEEEHARSECLFDVLARIRYVRENPSRSHRRILKKILELAYVVPKIGEEDDASDGDEDDYGSDADGGEGEFGMCGFGDEDDEEEEAQLGITNNNTSHARMDSSSSDSEEEAEEVKQDGKNNTSFSTCLALVKSKKPLDIPAMLFGVAYVIKGLQFGGVILSDCAEDMLFTSLHTTRKECLATTNLAAWVKQVQLKNSKQPTSGTAPANLCVTNVLLTRAVHALAMPMAAFQLASHFLAQSEDNS